MRITPPGRSLESEEDLIEAASFSPKKDTRKTAIRRMREGLNLEGLQQVATTGNFHDSRKEALRTLEFFIKATGSIKPTEENELHDLLDKVRFGSQSKQKRFDLLRRAALAGTSGMRRRDVTAFESLSRSEGRTPKEEVRFRKLKTRVARSLSPAELLELQGLVLNAHPEKPAAVLGERFLELAYKNTFPRHERVKLEERALNALRRVGGRANEPTVGRIAIRILARHNRLWDVSRIGRHCPDPRLRDEVMTLLKKRNAWAEMKSIAAHSFAPETRDLALETIRARRPDMLGDIAASTAYEDTSLKALGDLVNANEHQNLLRVFRETKYPKVRMAIVHAFNRSKKMGYLAMAAAHTNDEAAADVALGFLHPTQARKGLNRMGPVEREATKGEIQDALDYIQRHGFLATARANAYKANLAWFGRGERKPKKH